MDNENSRAALDGRILDELYAVIDNRRAADPGKSYTAKLYRKGPAKIAQKLGEEAVEALIEGALGRKDELTTESADLLYHLIVLWAACGVEPADVWQALEERKGISGLARKAARKLQRQIESGER